MEEYRVIEGFENYSISNFGNVKNNKTGRILKNSINAQGYFRVNFTGCVKKIHKLVAQAFIPNPQNNICIDHIDNDKLNNNVNNLRWCSQQQNCKNRSLASNNTSGHMGIRFLHQKNKWQARISNNGVDKHLGYFETKEEAIEARLKAVEKYFGEYANKCEKELILNIKLPKHTKLNLTINIDEDEEYRQLENEFEGKINQKGPEL
jgi:hypothetical protein